MKYDDRTEIRHFKKDKRHWEAAAHIQQKTLSEWIREALNTEADKELSNY